MSAGQQHTAGPWNCRSGYATVRDVNNNLICDTESGNRGWKGAEENAANARLIAAAPDLLEACEAAFIALGKLGANMIEGIGRKEWEQCRAAIARATA